MADGARFQLRHVRARQVLAPTAFLAMLALGFGCASTQDTGEAGQSAANLADMANETPDPLQNALAQEEARLRANLVNGPDDPRPFIELARFLLRTERPREAAEALDPWIEKHPSFGAAWRAKVAILEAGGLNDEAMSVIKKAASACPEDAEIFSVLSRMHLVREEFQPALGAAEVAVELDAENPLYHLQVLDLHALLEDIDAMKQAVKRGVANRPDMGPLFFMREAEWLDKAGRTEDSLAAIDKALAMDPESTPAILQKAALLNDLARFEESMNLLIDAMDRAPEDRRLVMVLAATTALFANQQASQGNTRIAEDPKDSGAYLMVARSFVLRGEREKGLAILTEGVIENPDAAELWMMIGALEQRAKRESEALSAYRMAIRLDKRNTTARNNMAYLLVTANDKALRNPREALTHARAALKLEPDNPAYLDTLAEVHFKIGDRRLAVRTIKLAIAIAPNETFFRSQLTRFEQEDPATSEPPLSP